MKAFTRRCSYIVAFALVWVANTYMSLFGRLRLDIRHERQEIEVADQVLHDTNSDSD